ncbi:MAG TPA: DEAD/DEAH box helicase [Myxococcales bacterium]
MEPSNVVPLLSGPALVKSVDASGRGRLLDEPALAFALRSALFGDARRDLQRALRPHPEATLRQLLDPVATGAPEPLHELHRSKMLAVVLGAVREFLASDAPTPTDVEARAKIPPPPSEPGELEAWLRATKMGPGATSPAGELLFFWAPSYLAAKMPRTTSLWSLATGGRPPLLTEPERELIQRCALGLLHAKALGGVVAPLSPDAIAPEAAAPLAHPGLEPLERALVQAYRELSRAHRGAPSRPPRFALTFTDDPLVFRWEGHYERERHHVTIDASDLSRPLAAYCSYRERDCDHPRAALADLVAWLHREPNPAHQTVVEVLTRPPWWRALRHLDDLAALASNHEKKQLEPVRITWRLSLFYGGLLLEPTLHRPTKKGGWSAGSRTKVEDLKRELPRLRFPNAERVLEVLVSERAPSCSDDRAARALLLLAGDPDLHLIDRLDAPLSVRKGALQVELAVRGGRLRPGATLDGVPIDEVVCGPAVDPDTARAEAEGRTRSQSVDFARAGRYLALLDHGGNTCTLAELTETQARLLDGIRGLDRLPEGALADLAPRLSALERHLPLKLPPELEGARVEADLRHLLRLTPQADGSLAVEVFVRPLGQGPVRFPGEEPRRLCGEVDGRRAHAIRDLAGELSRAQALLGELKLDAGEGLRRLLQGDAALDLLAALESRPDVVVEWPKQAQPVKILGRAQPGSLKVKLEAKRDWFGLEGTVQVGEDEIALAALLDAVRRGSRYVEVGQGRYAQIADELRARLKKASEVVFAGRGGLEVSLAGSDALADLLDAAGETSACVEWQKLVERMKAARSFDPPLPRGLNAELRAYQVAGFRWLMRMAHWGVGACLADDMGLGKTVQALAALLARRDRGPALVVAPTSVGFNWVRECERFTPGLRPVVFREGDRAATLKELGPGDLLVCSYGLLLRHAEDLQGVHFGTLVLDEAQAIKNPATKRARAARDLDAEWRVGLTGTPMENHLGELWSLLRVLTPGLLGSWEQFRDRFATPIERHKDPARREALAKVVRPFILRRGKAQVAPELPPRTELRRAVTLSAAERRLYEEARMAAVADLSGAAGGEAADKRFAVLAALTRLRQLACNPKLYDPGSKVPSSKLKALVELVGELREEGHRALVFSQFTSHLALVREALEEEGVKLLYLDGQTPEAERAKRVDAFQRGEGEAFLISLKAGGTGLNLTGADYVIHLDPWWNPAVEDQASDRAHRIGQTRPVTVYRLVSTGTIEEAILSLHEEKRDLVSGVLGGTGAAAKLSTEELLALIRAGEGAPETTEGEEDEEEADEAEEVTSRKRERAGNGQPSAVKGTETSTLRSGVEVAAPDGELGEKQHPEVWAQRFADWLLQASEVAGSTAKAYGGTFSRQVEGRIGELPEKCTAAELAQAVAALDGAPKMLKAALSQFRRWRGL